MNEPAATPDSLMDLEDAPVIPRPVVAAEKTKPEPQGLQKRFAKGEQIPWKGIWFEVFAVAAESIIVRPIGETWKHYKVRTGRSK